MFKKGYYNRIAAVFSGKGLRAELLRGGVGSLLIKAVQAALAFIVAIVLARVLGPEGYGVYAFALAVLMIVALPAQVGIPQLVVRETAKAQATENWGKMRGLWLWGNKAVYAFSSLAVLAIGCFLIFMTEITSERIATVAIGIALIPLIALSNVRAACLRGLRKVVLGQLPENVFRPVLLLLLLGSCTIIAGTEADFGAEQIMAIYVAAATGALLFSSVMLWRVKPEGLKSFPAPLYESESWRKAVIPLALISGIQVVNNYADLIILGFFRTDMEVGIYRAVYQIALLTYFGFQAANKVIQPHFSRMSINGKIDVAGLKLIKKTYIVVLGLSSPFLMVYIFFGKEIIELSFGNDFIIGYFSLVILSAGLVLKSIYGVTATAMNMAGYERKVLIVSVLSVLINVILNILTVPYFGMEGAAVSTTLSFVFLGGAIFWVASRSIMCEENN